MDGMLLFVLWTRNAMIELCVEPPHHEVVEGRFTIINVVGEQESESSS